MTKKYAQIETLSELFDLSPDWFIRRQKNAKKPDAPFKKGVHFFIPPSNSKTKHVVLWDVEAIDLYIRGRFEDQDPQNKKIIENILA